MGNLTRYRSSDLPELMDKIMRNSIGINDDYLDRFFNVSHTSNYPPFNLIQVNNVESRLEVALAGFKKDEVSVYTEFGKLFVEGKKTESENDGEFVHKGLAQRSFERQWTLAEDTEVRQVSFDDGLLVVELGRIVPDHHTRKEFL
jgi:HSP20 family molecular chaperone IbpA